MYEGRLPSKVLYEGTFVPSYELPSFNTRYLRTKVRINKTLIIKSPEDEWFVSVREGNFVRPPGGRHSRESAIRRFRRTRIGSEVEFVFPVKARIT